MDVEINYIWKNVAPDGRCSLHALSEVIGFPHEDLDELRYYLPLFFAQYQRHIIEEYKLGEQHSEEERNTAIEQYIATKNLLPDSAPEQRRTEARGLMAQERDNVLVLDGLVEDLRKHGDWDNSPVAAAGIFTDLMKWWLGVQFVGRNYQIITVESDHTFFDTNCPGDPHLCNSVAQEQIKTLAQSQNKSEALISNELIIFVTSGSHWGVLIPQDLMVRLNTNKDRLKANFPMAPSSSGAPGKLPAAPLVVDPNPSLPDWFKGKEFEPHFEGDKNNIDNPLTLVVPKFMDKIDKCAMIYDMLHDFADEGAITNKPVNQYWIFIKIAASIFVPEKATIEQIQENELEVLNCINSVFKNWWTEEKQLQIPEPDYNKGQNLYDVMHNFDKKETGFFKDMKTFLTDKDKGAQTLLYKNIFEQANKAFFFDPRMQPIIHYVEKEKYSEMVPTVKMMTTQGDDTGFGKRAEYNATPYQDNDGWNSLLNAMSQEYDGCDLKGEYPMGQFYIDNDFIGDEVTQGGVGLKEIINRYKEEEDEYKKYKLKKNIIETIKKKRWNEGIFAPETLFIDAMKTSGSVPAVAESIMRMYSGNEENIARNQTLKGPAQEFDMANAGFPIKENDGIYFGNIKPTHTYNGDELQLKDALNCRFEMRIYFDENKRLKMLQTPFSNEPVEHFLKITRLNYTNLLTFLKLKNIKTYKTGNNNNITISLMNEFFNNKDLFTLPGSILQMAGSNLNLLWQQDDISLFESMHKEAKSFYALYALQEREETEHLKPFLNTKDKEEERIFMGNNNKIYINFLKGGKKKGGIAGMDQYANYFRPRVRDTKKNKETRPTEIGLPDFLFLKEFENTDDKYYKAYLTHLLMHDMKTIETDGFTEHDTFNRIQIPTYEESIIQRFLNTIESSINQTNRKSIVKQSMVYEYKKEDIWVPTTGNFNCLSYGQQGPSVMQLELQWRKLLLSITKNVGIKTSADETSTFIKKNSERDPSSRIKGKVAMKRGTPLHNVIEKQQNSWFKDMVEIEKKENSKKEPTKKEVKADDNYKMYLRVRDVFDLYLALDQLCVDIKEEEDTPQEIIESINEILGSIDGSGMRGYININKIDEPNANTKLPNEGKVKEYEDYFKDRSNEILSLFDPAGSNHGKWTEHLTVLQSNAFSSRSTSDDLFKTTRLFIHTNLNDKIKMIDCWKLLSMPLLTKFYSDSGQIQYIKGISCLFRKDKNGKIYKYWIITFDITCGLIALKEGNVMLETGKRIFTGSSGPIDLETRKKAEAIMKKKINEIDKNEELEGKQKDNKKNALRFLYNICPDVLIRENIDINDNFFVDIDDDISETTLGNTLNLKKTNKINKQIFKETDLEKAEQYEIFNECSREVELNTLLDESIALSDDKDQTDEFSLQMQELKQLVNQLKRLRFQKDNKKAALLFELSQWQNMQPQSEVDEHIAAEEQEFEINIERVKRIIDAHDRDLKVIEKTIKNWETVIKDKISLSSRATDVTRLIFILKDFLNNIDKNKFIFAGRSGNLPSEMILNDIRPSGMMGDIYQGDDMRKEDAVAKDEDKDVFSLFHLSANQWYTHETFHHENRKQKRKKKRDKMEDMKEPTDEEEDEVKELGYDRGLEKKIVGKGSIYQQTKKWMEKKNLLELDKDEVNLLKGKKKKLPKAKKGEEEKKKIIKTIVILEMMGKIKYTENESNPLDERIYDVELEAVTEDEIKAIKESIYISSPNNDDTLQQFYESWTLKFLDKKRDQDEKKGKFIDTRKTLMANLLKKGKEIQEYYKKAFLDNKIMYSENSDIRKISKPEYVEFVKPHIPEKNNAYRKIVKFSIKKTFSDPPPVFKEKMDTLAEMWGTNGNTFKENIKKRTEERKKQAKEDKENDMEKNKHLSPSRIQGSPKKLTPGKIPTQTLPSSGSDLDSSSDSDDPKEVVTAAKKKLMEVEKLSKTGRKRRLSVSEEDKQKLDSMLDPSILPTSPQAVKERNEMTIEELTKAKEVIKKQKTSGNIPHDFADQKLYLLEAETRKRERGPTVRKVGKNQKKPKTGGNKTQKIRRKKGRKSRNNRKQGGKGSKKRHKKPHRNTRKIALKIEN